MNKSSRNLDTKDGPVEQAAPSATMRAVVIDAYGPPEELRPGQVARPKCGEHQVLVRVRAAGVNPIDWRLRSGSLRMLLPARFPLVLGFDAAGEIVEVSRQAKSRGWRVGDEVLSFLEHWHGGGYAEFAVAGVNAIARMPPGLSFIEAAAVPLAASTALQSLRDHRRLQADQSLLVNGASGGVGTFAVQIGKAMGAQVTGVCSEANLGFVKGLGADRVIDYRREDFKNPMKTAARGAAPAARGSSIRGASGPSTDQAQTYDMVFDAVAKSSYWKCRRVLRPRGCYLRTVPSISSVLFQCFNLFSRRLCRNVLARPRAEDLRQIAQMIGEGKLRPVVQDVYPLEEAATAHRVSEAGHVRGKLVLSV